jgi:predicted Fe-Mo cluster-binding NifX family protein
MNIAVSSAGQGLESQVDKRFGRCHYFVLVEMEGKAIKGSKSVENVSANQMGGAGMTAAQAVADLRADAIITGNMGPRAFSVFQQLGIDVYEGSGTVREAVESLAAGKLRKIESATGPQNMGMPGGGE